MNRTICLCLCAVLALGSGCGDDDTTSPDGGQALEGTVQHFLRAGEPVSGMRVGTPDGAIDVTDASGVFRLEGVSAPYDLVAVSQTGSGLSGMILAGIDDGREASPLLGGVPAGYNSPVPSKSLLGRTRPRDKAGYDQDAGALEGTIANADPAGDSIAMSAGGDGFSVDRSGIDPGSGTYGPWTIHWPTSPSHQVGVAALQLDSGGAFLYGRADDVTLQRNGTSTVNIALNAVAGGAGSVAVSLSPPGGLSLATTTWTAFTLVDGLVVQADRLTGASGTLALPPLPGAVHMVTASASLEDGGSHAGGFNGLWSDVTDGASLNVTAPMPTAVTAPVDGAAAVPLDTGFTVSGSPDDIGAILNVVGIDPYGDVQQNWIVQIPGDAVQADLPRCPELNAELFPSAEYEVQLLSLVEGPELTPANVLRLVNTLYSPGQDHELSRSGPIRIVSGPFNTFTTAPQ